ncbi:MAG: hypothetical protein AMJ92_05545 [candidate division Zixibacteria bacterium SM23_81]|nr:MAG: hypothetical protein AMJ92_05545 [candidate division Zixibacteria bacterium SM23_81]
MIESKGKDEHRDRDDVRQDRDEEDRDQGNPAPPRRRKRSRKHWDHLPGSKRKSIRSYKSPGRK